MNLTRPILECTLAPHAKYKGGVIRAMIRKSIESPEETRPFKEGKGLGFAEDQPDYTNLPRVDLPSDSV